jgi:nitrate reductase NapE
MFRAPVSLIPGAPHPGEATLSEEAVTKTNERRAFLFLAVFLAPILSIAIVGGYGFLVWIMQLLTGPPGS